MKSKNLIGPAGFLLSAMVFLSCSNAADSKTNNNAPAAETTTPAPATGESNAPSSEPAETAVVSFKVNGVEANTKPSARDNDKQLALLNWKNKHITVDLMGDDPKFPHRGSLNLVVDGFKMEPATYTMGKDCYINFSRYTTENAGGETQYSAALPGPYGSQEERANNAKRKCTITFTKVEKAASEFGEKYLVSGTFSGTATLSLGFKNEVPVLEITDGKFENVPVSVLGK